MKSKPDSDLSINNRSSGVRVALIEGELTETGSIEEASVVGVLFSIPRGTSPPEIERLKALALGNNAKRIDVVGIAKGGRVSATIGRLTVVGTMFKVKGDLSDAADDTNDGVDAGSKSDPIPSVLAQHSVFQKKSTSDAQEEQLSQAQTVAGMTNGDFHGRDINVIGKKIVNKTYNYRCPGQLPFIAVSVVIIMIAIMVRVLLSSQNNALLSGITYLELLFVLLPAASMLYMISRDNYRGVFGVAALSMVCLMARLNIFNSDQVEQFQTGHRIERGINADRGSTVEVHVGDTHSYYYERSADKPV